MCADTFQIWKPDEIHKGLLKHFKTAKAHRPFLKAEWYRIHKWAKNYYVGYVSDTGRVRLYCSLNQQVGSAFSFPLLNMDLHNLQIRDIHLINSHVYGTNKSSLCWTWTNVMQLSTDPHHDRRPLAGIHTVCISGSQQRSLVSNVKAQL